MVLTALAAQVSKPGEGSECVQAFIDEVEFSGSIRSDVKTEQSILKLAYAKYEKLMTLATPGRRNEAGVRGS